MPYTRIQFTSSRKTVSPAVCDRAGTSCSVPVHIHTIVSAEAHPVRLPICGGRGAWSTCIMANLSDVIVPSPIPCVAARRCKQITHVSCHFLISTTIELHLRTYVAIRPTLPCYCALRSRGPSAAGHFSCLLLLHHRSRCCLLALVLLSQSPCG